jgi:hypothetical protein
MAIAIPLFALLKSEKGLTLHMESLCMLGFISSLIFLIICMVVLVEFPKTSRDEGAVRWIGTINGKDLPQDL